LLVLMLASAAAPAVEILDSSVQKKDGRYHVVGTSLLQARPEFVFATLMDYDNFHKLAGGIVETRFVTSDVPGEVLGYTRIESCVLFFCRSAEKIERIEATPHREIRTYTIPERSDFEVNDTRWILTPKGDFTELTYEAVFKPKFWIPPLIDTWAIKRKMLASAENIGMRIEFMAQRGLTLERVREATED
jgi:hypothetical protein